MTTGISDTAIAAALERAIGHVQPYTDAELASVRELRVVGAASLADLTVCGGLERLEIVGSEIRDLEGLSTLQRLRSLRVLACPIENARGLAGLDRLEELRLDFTFVEDAAPVFSLPSLQRARLLGNPWSEESFRRLREHGIQTSREAPKPIFELGAPAEVELDVTRQLRKLGLGLCFASLDELRSVLVRPGIARVPGEECDWTVASAAGAWLDEKGETTTDSFFEMIRQYRSSRGENRSFDFESHRELGDRDDALRWIAAEDDVERRAALRRFIERFPRAIFFREDQSFQDMVEHHGGIALPAAYRRARAILAGAFPERLAEYRVDQFEGSSPRVSSVPEIWYRPRFESYDSDEGPTLRETVRVYPFTLWPVQKGSVLAVSLEAGDSGIYEYGETDLFDTLRLGQPARASLYRVYSSYAELLAHIAAFKLPDGTIINARPELTAGRESAE